jgi:hypothetical protein
MSTEAAASAANAAPAEAFQDAADGVEDSASDATVITEEETVGATTAADDILKARGGAPQAKEGDLENSPGVFGEEAYEDCKLTPLEAENQKRNLMDALMSDGTAVADPPDAEVEEVRQQSSLLHRDEYSQLKKQPHHPINRESALANSSNCSGFTGLAVPPLLPGKAAKPTRQRLQGKHHGHSHPRKSPYRSEVARLRHEQQQQQQARNSNNDHNSVSSTTNTHNTTNISLASTTSPPDSSDFWKQSSKFKHMILDSMGEFLTSAFTDNEETSASYFSQELLDQLSNNDPDIVGIWLQSKNLYDVHIRQLCDNLMRNTQVTEVWLPGNFITDEGARYIAHMLKFNKSIKELFLGKNDIGPRGAAALAAALARGNTTLVALGLGENHVGVEGAGAFAAALRHNHVLRTLDLKKNGIPKSSSVRALLNKMLEFNASDPGDEFLVLGLQEELTSLIKNLPEDVAQNVMEQAEEALKTAMVCRRKGDVWGAAEAEGLFIRICTTGQAPMDPPEETTIGGVTITGRTGSSSSRKRPDGGRRVAAAKSRSNGNSNRNGGRGKRRSIPSEPDRLDAINEELSALHFAEASTKNVDNDDEEDIHFNDDEEVGGDDNGATDKSAEEDDGKDAVTSEETGKGDEDKMSVDGDKRETINASSSDYEEGGGGEGTNQKAALEP